jgi:hypothetical protein
VAEAEGCTVVKRLTMVYEIKEMVKDRQKRYIYRKLKVLLERGMIVEQSTRMVQERKVIYSRTDIVKCILTFIICVSTTYFVLYYREQRMVELSCRKKCLILR